MENELIQYYIVNKDLNMSPGKIAAQVAHAATTVALRSSDTTVALRSSDTTVALRSSDTDKFMAWFNNSQKKIILGAHQKELEKISKLPFATTIYDSGLTEIPAGSLTVVVIGPISRLEAKNRIKGIQRLQLL